MAYRLIDSHLHSYSKSRDAITSENGHMVGIYILPYSKDILPYGNLVK